MTSRQYDVYAVTVSNYYPAEVVGLYTNADAAQDHVDAHRGHDYRVRVLPVHSRYEREDAD